MKTSKLVREVALGLGFLCAGSFLAAMFFNGPLGALAGSQTPGDASGIGPPAAAGKGGGGAEREAAEPEPPMDHGRIAAFARRFDAIDGSPARIEAVMDWFDSFGEEDFAPFVQILFATIEDEGGELFADEDAGLVEGLVEWVFGEQEIVGSYFCECWATTSPDTLVTALGTLPPDRALSIGTYALPFLWARDPEGAQLALDGLRQRSPEQFGDEFDEDEFMHQLYQVSEVAALRWMAENYPDELYLEDLITNGVSDPHGVIREVFKWSPKEAREEALSSLLDYYSVVDPGMALELLRSHASEFDDDQREEVDGWAAELATSHWVLEDPASRLDLEAEDYDASNLLREWLLRDHESALAWVMTQEDNPAAYVEFARIVGTELDELPFDFAIRFARPGEAPTWAAALSDEQLGQLMKRSPEAGIRELYRRDPEAALGLVADSESDSLCGELFEAVEDSDARGRLFAELSPQGRSAMADQLLGSWAGDDPAAAFEASAGHPEGAAAAVNQWLRFEDAEQVYAAVGTRFGENTQIQNAIIDAWAARDPWAAGATLQADGQGDGIPRLVSRWVGSDSIEASRFIRENLEPGAVRDQAVGELALGIAGRDPAAAREWAASIDGEDLRAQVLNSLAPPKQ